MKKNKYVAFTIAEAIVSFILIGMLFVLTLTGLNRKTDYHILYLQAFNTLYQASKTAYSEWSTNTKCSCNKNENERDICGLSKCWRNSKYTENNAAKEQERTYEYGTKYIDRDWPGFLYGNNPDGVYISSINNTDFCEILTKYINTYSGNKCQNFIYEIDNKDANPDENAVKFYDLFKTNDNKKGLSPTFTASNGQQFYISDVVTANFKKDDAESFNHLSRESYRLVVVDLNGKSSPNSQFKKKSSNPDLVLFAITSLGDVIPLGLPEFTKEYINAAIYYPNYTTEDGSRKHPVKSETMTLWKAKQKAWGYSKADANSISMSPVSVHEPLSQSAKLYKIAEQCRGKKCSNQVCTGKYTDKNNNTRNIKVTCTDSTTKERYADNLLVELILQFMYSKEGKFNEENNAMYSMDINNFVDSEHDCITVKKESDSPTCGIDFE